MRNPFLAAVGQMGGRPRASYYNGAAQGRLHMDWLMSVTSADEVLRSDMVILRTRARDLTMSNSTASRIPQLFSENVIGKDGITLQAKVQKIRGQGTDERINDLIEEWWYGWGEKETCTTDGRLSWLDVETLTAETEPTDGEVLIRIVDGFPNKYGFALEFLDADQLDAGYNRRPSETQNEIRMGIEVDRWGRPLTYHLWSDHPGEIRKRDRVAVPADDIIHLYLSRRPRQSRGVTWFAPVVVDLQQLGGYREAHVIAARIGASKMGFYTQTSPDAQRDPNEPDTELSTEVAPGMMEELPFGVGFTPWDPKFPDANFDGLDKAMLRSVGTAVRVSYQSISSDLTQTSYASGRLGALAERAVYQKLQQRLIEHVHRRVYRRGLRMAVTTGVLNLDPVQLARYSRADTWHPRSFPWVDPSKDIDFAERQVALGINTLTSLAAEQGRDLEEVFAERKRELDMAARYGIPLQLPQPSAGPGRPPNDAKGARNAAPDRDDDTDPEED